MDERANHLIFSPFLPSLDTKPNTTENVHHVTHIFKGIPEKEKA